MRFVFTAAASVLSVLSLAADVVRADDGDDTETGNSIGDPTLIEPIESDVTVADTMSVSLPWQWRDSIAIKLGISAAIYGATLLIDKPAFDFFERNKSGVGDNIGRWGDNLGAPQNTVPLAVGAFALGHLSDKKWVRNTGLMWFETLALVALVQQPARVIAGRARPRRGDGSTDFDPFTFEKSRASFISGHSASTVGMATILARQTHNVPAKVAIYSVAAITPLSRMYEQEHWLSDITVGSALGYFIGTTVWNWHAQPNGDDDDLSTDQGVQVNLRPYGTGAAVSVVF